MWRGSDGPTVLRLLTDLPARGANLPLRQLARRLLVTGGPLAGLATAGQLLEQRLANLLALGELAAAQQLAAQVPEGPTGAPLDRRQVELALLTGDDGRTCRQVDQQVAASDAAFWRELAVYCRLVTDDQAGAQLALDLLRETGKSAPGLLALAGQLLAPAAGATAPPELSQVGPLELAMLRRAGAPLPAAAVPETSAGVLAAALALPELAAAIGPAEAEQAYLAGALDGPALGRLYIATADTEAKSDLLQQIARDWRPATRARLRRAVELEPLDRVRAELLNAGWQRASGPERLVYAAAFAEPIAQLPAGLDLAFVAPAMARAALAVGDRVRARAWRDLLTGGRSQAADAEVARLQPLLALADASAAPAGAADAPLGLERVAELAPPGAPDAPPLAQLLGLLEGAGRTVPPALWQDLLQPPFGPVQAALPPAPLWRSLDEAAAAGRRGETVLLVLHMLAGQPEAAHPEVLRRSLAALQAVGLGAEAQAIATATALAAGW